MRNLKTHLPTVVHKDGTISYWSVYRATWIRRAREVPDCELAAMMPEERKRVIRHLEKGAGR